MKTALILVAIAVGALTASAERHYDFQDTSRRVEVVPSQGTAQLSSGFSMRLVDRAYSQSILLSLWHGLVLILK